MMVEGMNKNMNSMEMVNQTVSNYYTQSETDAEGFTSIFKVMADTQKAYEESSEGMMVAAFIKANRLMCLLFVV